MTNLEIENIKQIVISCARHELLPCFSNITHQQKKDGSIVTEADVAIQESIINSLLNCYPGSVVLSEEMTPEQQQNVLQSDKTIWCLDPIDGTSNFAFGIPYFAVSLARIEAGKVTLGIVYDPVRDECFTAYNNKAWLNNNSLSIGDVDISLPQAMAIIDFKRLPENLSSKLVTHSPFASQRNFGASALDWCWLAAKRGHIYLHGAQNIWDYAAGHFIFSLAGGYSETLESENIFSYKLEKRSVVAAVDSTLFDNWKHWLASD